MRLFYNILAIVSLLLARECTLTYAGKDGMDELKFKINDSKWKKPFAEFEQNITQKLNATSKTDSNPPPLLLSKLSKIGRPRISESRKSYSYQRLKQPRQSEFKNVMGLDLSETYDDFENNMKKKMKSNFINEVEFTYDPEIANKKKSQQQQQQTQSEMPKIDKEKIKITRGFQQISSIYKSLRRGDIIYGNGDINTIRFIPSVRVESNKKLHFVFNLSLLTNTENLIKSELYVNKKHIKQRLIFNLHYLLYSKSMSPRTSQSNQSKPQLSTQLDLSNLRLDKYSLVRTNNWHLFSLVDSLRSYLNARRNEFDQAELMLIMESTKFSPKSGIGIGNSNTDVTNPYLMIYTKEEALQMKQFFQNRIPSELQPSPKTTTTQPTSTVKDDIDTAEIITESLIEKPSMPNTISYQSMHDKSIILVEERPQYNADTINKLKKNASSLLYNYLPKLRRDGKRNISPSFEDLDEDDVDSTQMLSWNVSSWNKNETDLLSQQQKECQAHPFEVDFDDMGFSSWLLEPKRYGTNYCAGKCTFPVNQKISYSNYATLQSIINAFDFNARQNSPPELCCTPSATKPTPIFFSDTNSVDYVVKLLPDMIVSECVCR